MELPKYVMLILMQPIGVYSSLTFADKMATIQSILKLKSGVVVAEKHPQHIIWILSKPQNLTLHKSSKKCNLQDLTKTLWLL